MKIFAAAALTSSLLLVPLWSNAGETFSVKLTGLNSHNGHIMGVFYRSQEDFNSGQNVINPIRVPVTSDTLVIRFNSLDEERVMFTVFHDENNNGILDTNLFGLPTEPYGFSNNARGRFGPPSYDKAAFNPNTIDEMSVELK